MARRTPRTLAGSKGRLVLVTGSKPTTAPTDNTHGEEIDASSPNPSRWLLKIRASVTATPSTIVGGTLYIYDDNMWYSLVVVNGDGGVVVGAQGYAEVVSDISLGTRVAFAGSAVDENIEVYLVPLIEVEV